MFDGFAQAGHWVLFTAIPFVVGMALLFVPVWLVSELVYRRRLRSWGRWAARVYPQVQRLGQSWAMDAPPEIASALCHVVWLLYLQQVCRTNRVAKLRWEAGPHESWAAYEGRIRFRFAILRALSPPDSRLRLTPLTALLKEVHLVCTLGAEHCQALQDYEAEKEIRRAAWRAFQDFGKSDEHGALFAISTYDYWEKKIDALREHLPEASPGRTKSIEELAREYNNPRWQEGE